jgi:hypothetical protein
MVTPDAWQGSSPWIEEWEPAVAQVLAEQALA